MSKLVLISGISGQLGCYMAELLLSKKYRVVGLYRRNANLNLSNLKNIIGNSNFELECGDITDQGCVLGLMNKHKPDEVYNCAAQSFVKISFDEPSHTFNVDTLGVLNFLEAIRILKLNTKFFTMSTSEMFGKSVSYVENNRRYECFIKDAPKDIELFQDEYTTLTPQSPYGIAKLAAYHLVRLYRESYGIFCCSNINFNFESKIRGKEFVTRKITNHIGKLANWHGPSLSRSSTLSLDMEFKTDRKFPVPVITDETKLALGNLKAKRDWSHAKDVAKACWLTVQQDNPCDYVVSSMQTHSVEDFCKLAFGHIGIENYMDYITIDPKFYRPAEVDYLLGDSSCIRQKLGWQPTVTFEELVEEMVYNDIKGN